MALSKAQKFDILKENIKENSYLLNKLALSAVAHNNEPYLKILIELGAKDNFNEYMNDAAFKGYVDIVKLMLKHGADDFESSIESATIKGHIDIVKLFIKEGWDDFNLVMSLAASNGHIDIVKLMLELGADDIEQAVFSAKCGKHYEIVGFLNERIFELIKRKQCFSQKAKQC